MPPTPPAGPDDVLSRPDRTWPAVPLTAGDLALVTRSGFVESHHVGHGVVLDPGGRVLAAVGAADALLYPRSALKPVQAAACLLSGARLAGARLAIAAGSHRGHPDHRDLVGAVLAAHGLEPDALQTPPDLPIEGWAKDDVVAAGGGPEPIHHNCSGKHAAMLAACVAAGWETAGYRRPDHPLQRRVRDLVAQVTGGPVTHVGVDGCGTPLFTTTLAGLARATGRVGAAASRHAATAPTTSDGSGEATVATAVGWPPGEAAVDRALGRVGRAMRTHPWAVSGSGAEDTVVMERLDGVVAKGGAEGVMALGTADGHGVAVKVLDGRQRAAMPAALALLGPAGIDATAVADEVASRTRGHGRAVGRVHVAAGLHDLARLAAWPSPGGTG